MTDASPGRYILENRMASGTEEAHTCNPKSQEVVEKESRVQGQPGLHSTTLLVSENKVKHTKENGKTVIKTLYSAVLMSVWRNANLLTRLVGMGKTSATRKNSPSVSQSLSKIVM